MAAGPATGVGEAAGKKKGSGTMTGGQVFSSSLGTARGRGASVAWWGADKGGDDALREHVATLLDAEGATLKEVRVGRLCPACGSDRHGRPWARWGDREVHLSLARTTGYVVTAVCLDGPVGVDVEVVQDVARRWSPDLVLARGESATTADEQARCWAAKEAVLKRRGTGLATPMTQVRLADEPGLQDLAAPSGLVAVLAGPRPVPTPAATAVARE